MDFSGVFRTFHCVWKTCIDSSLVPFFHFFCCCMTRTTMWNQFCNLKCTLCTICSPFRAAQTRFHFICKVELMIAFCCAAQSRVWKMLPFSIAFRQSLSTNAKLNISFVLLGVSVYTHSQKWLNFGCILTEFWLYFVCILTAYWQYICSI